MTFRTRPSHPYGHAPRLPDDETLDVRAVLRRDGARFEGPIELEIGPGRGGFLFERCAARPEAFVFGLEIRLKWATLVDERLVAAGLGGQGRVFAADAREVFAKLGPEASIEVIYLQFPDPWWKKRHEKRLVMGEPLLADIARLLVDNGELFIQTDVEERAAQCREVVSTCAELVPAGDAEGSPMLAENPYQARSPREHHAIRDGLPIERMRYRRVSRATRS